MLLMMSESPKSEKVSIKSVPLTGTFSQDSKSLALTDRFRHRISEIMTVREIILLEVVN